MTVAEEIADALADLIRESPTTISISGRSVEAFVGTKTKDFQYNDGYTHDGETVTIACSTEDFGSRGHKTLIKIGATFYNPAVIMNHGSIVEAELRRANKA